MNNITRGYNLCRRLVKKLGGGGMTMRGSADLTIPLNRQVLAILRPVSSVYRTFPFHIHAHHFGWSIQSTPDKMSRYVLTTSHLHERRSLFFTRRVSSCTLGALLGRTISSALIWGTSPYVCSPTLPQGWLQAPTSCPYPTPSESIDVEKSTSSP
jgi:hypothetical protein